MLSLSLWTPFPIDWRRSLSSVTLADLNRVPAGWSHLGSQLKFCRPTPGAHFATDERRCANDTTL